MGATTPNLAADDQEVDDDETETDEDETDETIEDDDFDKERALSTIRRQRESEKALKKQLSDLQGEVKKLQRKGESQDETTKRDLEETRERAEKAEKSLQKQLLRSSALEAATDLRFRSPSLAVRLIDADEVEWDDGEPTNIKRLLKDVLKLDPSLKKGAEDEDDDDGADAGAGRGRGSRRGGGFDMNSQIRAAAGH